MKYQIYLYAIVASVVCISSCNDDPGTGPNNFTATGISNVKTVNNNNYNSWQASPTTFFTNVGPNFSSWSLTIGNSTGSFYETSVGNENHWKGYISYTEKDKHCNDIVYCDSLSLDIATTNESGWNQVVFCTNSYTFTNGQTSSLPGNGQNKYFAKTDAAGDINSISLYNVNEVYLFEMKTIEKDNFNSWKLINTPQGWMCEQGRISLLILPALYTIFQQ